MSWFKISYLRRWKMYEKTYLWRKRGVKRYKRQMSVHPWNGNGSKTVAALGTAVVGLEMVPTAGDTRCCLPLSWARTCQVATAGDPASHSGQTSERPRWPTPAWRRRCWAGGRWTTWRTRPSLGGSASTSSRWLFVFVLLWGLIDGSYMKCPHQLSYNFLLEGSPSSNYLNHGHCSMIVLLEKNWAHYLFAQLKIIISDYLGVTLKVQRTK